MFDNELFLRGKVESTLESIIEEEFDYNIKLNIDYKKQFYKSKLAYFWANDDDREIKILIDNFFNFNYNTSIKDILFL